MASRRVHAGLTMGCGISVSLGTVAKLMRAHSVVGVPTRRKYHRKNTSATTQDLLNRTFDRGDLNQVWVSDATQHPTRGGVLYCFGRAGYQLEKDCWLLDQLEPNQPLGYQCIGYSHKTP